MNIELPDGTPVEAKQLRQPIGQFTHWYMDGNGEPKYLVVREANEKSYLFNRDVNKALTAALASDRYMVAVFVVEAAENGADRKIVMHRVSHQFPFDGFEFAKNEFAANLDSEWKPPQPLQLANFLEHPEQLLPNQGPGEQLQQKVVHKGDPSFPHPHVNEDLVEKLRQMNDQAVTEGTVEQPPVSLR